MLNYYEIGQRIRKVRRAHNLSQEQLAEKIDISVAHMSHIETGNTKLSLPVLANIALALNVGTDELLFDASGQGRQEVISDIHVLLESCSPRQAKIISEIITSAKHAMDAYE